jgi:RimJ/RimL family protein N-acetyltransferase
MMVCSDTPATRYLELINATPLEGGLAFTGVDGDKVLGCIGALELWSGRYMAWAYISPLLTPTSYAYWKGINSRIQTFFEALDARRIEAEVDADFAAGHRWMKRLGFICEAERMSGYFPDGRDASLYAKVRK